MKRFLVGVLIVFALALPVVAGESEKITVADTAKSLTATIYLNSVRAYCYVGAYPLRWTTDATTAPTTTSGINQAAGTYITLTSNTQIRLFRAIRTTADSATLDCQYWNAGEY